MIQVTFRDTKSYERIPPTSETISVNLPTTIRDRFGGLGLDELEPLLESQDYLKDGGVPALGSIIDSVIEQKQRKDNTTESSIEVKVERSGTQVSWFNFSSILLRRLSSQVLNFSPHHPCIRPSRDEMATKLRVTSCIGLVLMSFDLSRLELPFQRVYFLSPQMSIILNCD